MYSKYYDDYFYDEDPEYRFSHNIEPFLERFQYEQRTGRKFGEIIVKAEEYLKSVKNKKVTAIGIGVSNLPLIRLLAENGAVVTARDRKTEKELGETAETLKNMGVTLVCGEEYLENIEADIIFKSPGIRPDLPQLKEAVKKGAQLTGEMELFFDLCPCEIFAVTGSDGKTTTTTLIYEMLKKAGYTCYLGGNIGNPLIGEVLKMHRDDKVVVELSSFQLFTMKKSPDTAVITNITPNHLDWHKDMKEYEDAKKNIYRYQSGNNQLILNSSRENTRLLMLDAKSRVITFGEKTGNGVYLENDIIYMSKMGEKHEIMPKTLIKLPGSHNVENYMAAIAAVWNYVTIEDIRYVAENFRGVPHRIELVCEKNGVRYYNDSIASSPTRTLAALNSFDEKLILIAGGYDKKIPFDPIGKKVNETVKELVLVGATAEKIKEAVEKAGGDTRITVVKTFEEAVKTAESLAKEGDTVILSPMCASFDLFKNFEQRGNRFKELVNRE